MKNELYTVFVSKTGLEIDSVLLVETKDFNKYITAKKWAKNNGYIIIREYLPDTIINKPNFIQSINN